MEAEIPILDHKQIDEGTKRETTAMETIYQHPLLLGEEQTESHKQALCKGCLQPISGPYDSCRICFRQPCLASELRPPWSCKSKMQLEDCTDHAIQFLVPDDSTDLITQVIEQMRLSENENAPQVAMKHFSHKHPVKLSTQQNLDGVCPEDKNRSLKVLKNVEICEGCMRPISAPFYSCAECSFFIHRCCAELPSEIQHPFHPEHPLILLDKATNEFADLFLCNACQSTSNGFAYSCASCDFYLDVFCSFLSDTLIHEAHQHPLVLRQDSKSINCNACHKPCEGFLFGCCTCGFNLDILCASYPGTVVRHGYHKHPLKLKVLLTLRDSYEFCCGICEKNLSVEDGWLYCCLDCDNVFHPRCIYNEYQFIKFGGTMDLKGHPHPVSLVLKKGKEPPCNNCGLPYDGISFECAECRYNVDELEYRFNLDGPCAQILSMAEYDSQNE